MAAPLLRPLSLGEVLDVSFGLYRAQFLSLIVVAAVTRVVPTALQVYVNLSGGMTEHLVLFAVYMCLAVVAGALGVAATTFVVSSAYLGSEMTPGEAFNRASGFIGRIVLVSIMSGIVIFGGFLLLFIPGVIVFAALALRIPAMVLEQLPTASAAMSRSWELTKGFRWKVFLAIFTAALLIVVPTMIIGAIVGLTTLRTGTEDTLVPDLVTSILQVFVYPFIYVVTTVLYYDLRVRKEGFDLELLATAAQSA